MKPTDSVTIENILYEIQNLGVAITHQQAEKIFSYFELLDKWNQKHNLTRIKKRDLLRWHLLDAVSVMPYCVGERILDVGTGAGIPGIILGILLSNKKFILIDNQSKKCIFLKYVINVLALDNVECIHQSVQNYHPDYKFNTIISRAFAQLAKFVQLCNHLLVSDGRFVAMKGDISEEELTNIPEGFELYEKAPLSVPGMSSRYAVVVVPKCTS
ncbi:MAG: 16S rRNA (guanine(527)-N(7))-methyltransferase RsmG [Candidatus Berkiella sp.]